MSALATRTKPSEAEVLGWMESLKSWGRWGKDDLRGTLNHIEPQHVVAASRLVRTGTTISCSIPITYNREPHGATGNQGKGSAWKVAPQQFIIQGGDASKPDDHEMKHGGDVFLIAPHGSTMTHLDAPCHLLYKGLMYNGLPSRRLSSDHGADDGSIELARSGIVSRGVLLDIPGSLGRDWLDDGEALYPEDLEACEKKQGVRVGKGDLLLIRSGYRKRNLYGAATKRPGMQAACLPWLANREVALITGDVTQDVNPHGYSFGSPIHTVGIWAMGLWLLDNSNLEQLAEHCAAEKRWEFLLSISPLVLTKGTGSPVNPLAIF